MTYRLLILSKAEQDIDAIYDEITGAAGAEIPDRYVGGLFDLLESLLDYPARGTIRRSKIPGLRIIGYRGSASIAFSIDGNLVTILGVFRRGRNIEDDILSARR